ncbi:hypothetical protein ACHAXR_004483 [Thalassiosira sp. AJA248-18]
MTVLGCSLFRLCTLSCPIISVLSLSSPATTTTELRADAGASSPTSYAVKRHLDLSGDWSTAKLALRHPKCCVVTVPGLEHHLSNLQQYFCGDDAPADLDLRMRVRCKGNEIEALSYGDCAKIYDVVMGPPTVRDSVNVINQNGNAFNAKDQNNNHPCILALEELARGVASLADGPLESKCTDVHMRVVCASNYRAIDPMFHTDKCPLRGYVTLTGSGTEYLDETCLPWEYAAIRTMGVDGLSAVSGKGKSQSLKMANELEFIVMKGDHYVAPLPDDISPSIIEKVWSRSSACVHRSPPGVSSENFTGGANGRRRVILSLDLADGMDDQEWHEIRRKRGWRSGMTQRKSRLVS